MPESSSAEPSTHFHDLLDELNSGVQAGRKRKIMYVQVVLLHVIKPINLRPVLVDHLDPTYVLLSGCHWELIHLLTWKVFCMTVWRPSLLNCEMKILSKPKMAKMGESADLLQRVKC